MSFILDALAERGSAKRKAARRGYTGRVSTGPRRVHQGSRTGRPWLDRASGAVFAQHPPRAGRRLFDGGRVVPAECRQSAGARLLTVAVDRPGRPRVTSLGSANHEHRWTVRRRTLWRARGYGGHGSPGALWSLAG